MPDFSARDPRLDTNAETTPAQAGSVHPAARSAMQRTQPRRASRLRNSFTAEDITDEDLAPPAPAVSDAPGFTAANMRSDDGPGRLSSTDGTGQYCGPMNPSFQITNWKPALRRLCGLAG